VKTHTAHLFEKLHVNDRAAAVAAAMRRGLLE
jgi:two-component system, NarL family, nitrate/nitrite response regulator NarL